MNKNDRLAQQSTKTIFAGNVTQCRTTTSAQKSRLCTKPNNWVAFEIGRKFMRRVRFRHSPEKRIRKNPLPNCTIPPRREIPYPPNGPKTLADADIARFDTQRTPRATLGQFSDSIRGCSDR